jgi:hypothetical protein
MKVICIDAGNKPKKIPFEEWIKEGEVYTIVEVVKMGLKPGTFGLRLKEVSLSEKSFPYEYYDASRFIPVESIKSQKEEVKEEVKEADLDLV